MNAPLSLTNEHVDALWATCVDNPCCASQRDLAFRWLEHIRVHSTAALDAAATRRLYERASALARARCGGVISPGRLNLHP